MAAAILGQLFLGWSMDHMLPDHSTAHAGVLAIHVSLGLTLLLFAVLRVAVRLTGGRAAPSPYLPKLERQAALATQGLLYGLMFALPLTGWTMVSARSSPLRFWGLSWPKLPGLGFMTGPEHLAIRHALTLVHGGLLGWALVALVALHVAGAIKHQFDGRPVLWRMAPRGRPPEA